MISNEKDFSDNLLTPFGYEQILKKINKELKVLQFDRTCKYYANNFHKTERNSTPSIISESRINSQDLILQNIIYLKQAKHFGHLAQQAIPEVKPLLYHYAETSLFAFFMHSLFSYNGTSQNHGLEIKIGENYSDIGIKIHKNGFFPRLINCYTLLGTFTIFSPFKINQNQQIEKNESKFSFITEPTLRLTEIIGMKSTSETREGFVDDILDYLLLFIASSLARYRPSRWHEIVEGEKGNEIVSFNRAFERYVIVGERILRTMHRISLGQHPLATLHEFDFMHSNSFYFEKH